MRDEGVFMSLVIHYWIGDVQDSQAVFASKMTYIVSGGALNSTHSLLYAIRMLYYSKYSIPTTAVYYCILSFVQPDFF